MAAREIVKNEMLKSLILLDTKRTFFGRPHRPHHPLFDDGAIRSNFMMAVRRMRGVSLSHHRISEVGRSIVILWPFLLTLTELFWGRLCSQRSDIFPPLYSRENIWSHRWLFVWCWCSLNVQLVEEKGAALLCIARGPRLSPAPTPRQAIPQLSNRGCWDSNMRCSALGMGEATYSCGDSSQPRLKSVGIPCRPPSPSSNSDHSRARAWCKDAFLSNSPWNFCIINQPSPLSLLREGIQSDAREIDHNSEDATLYSSVSLALSGACHVNSKLRVLKTMIHVVTDELAKHDRETHPSLRSKRLKMRWGARFSNVCKLVWLLWNRNWTDWLCERAKGQRIWPRALWNERGGAQLIIPTRRKKRRRRE